MRRCAPAVALGLALALTAGARAAEPAPEAVRAAREALATTDARPQIDALRVAVAAQEAALAAVRATLRAAADSRAAARRTLGARDGAVFATLAALHGIERAPPLALTLHPAGPLAAARAARALADAAPALRARAAAARAAVARYAALETRGAAATARLRAALAALQALRADHALEQGRGKSPQGRAATRRAAVAAVEAVAREAEAISALLSARPAPAGAAAGADPRAPVAQILRIEADGAGVALRAPAYAEVIAPMTASVRYAGEAGGAGLTVVLEPQAGVLIVLRGLGEVYRAAGDTVTAGQALGALGGPPRASEEFLIDASAPKGTIPAETLYIEVMRGGEPDDPAAWFALTAERTGG